MAFWRREPKTHEVVPPDYRGIAIRGGWIVAALGVFAWVWASLE